MYFGRFVMRKDKERRKEAKGFIIQENAKTLGVVQFTLLHTSPTKNVVP